MDVLFRSARFRVRWACVFVALAGAIGWETVALAQGFGGPQPQQPGRQPQPQKPAGPAEAAPEEDEDEAELPPLPQWPDKKKKRLVTFDIHGYFRVRADLQHNHNLGQQTIVLFGRQVRAPFWQPVSEDSENFNCASREDKSCQSKTLGGANMRLRIEPTINVSDHVRVHTQIDILDNVVLGSTPTSNTGMGAAPHEMTSLLANGQAAPVVGRNSNTPAIVVKRAWGEVDTPIGRLSAGRMPEQWGMGLFANDGSCWDCNFGDNRDRIALSTELANHRFLFAYDFAASGPNTFSVAYGQSQFGGQAIDIEQLDDVDQIVFNVGRIDSEEEIEEKLQRDEIVINYGAYFLWRRQKFGYADTVASGETAGLNSTTDVIAQALLERRGWMVLPDLWFKLMWEHLYIEFEGNMTIGKIRNVSQEDKRDPRDLLQFAFALRSRYGLFGDKLKVGLEVGMASGDDSELFDINRIRAPMVYPDIQDNSFNEGRFDPDYLVDLILFREIFGTVANAAYFKPTVQYDPFESLGVRMDMIYSVAHRQIAYPGNSPHLGLELDFDLYYRNRAEGFSTGVQYGVLFPFGGLDRPRRIFGEAGARDASIAHTVQGRLVIKF